MLEVCVQLFDLNLNIYYRPKRLKELFTERDIIADSLCKYGTFDCDKWFNSFATKTEITHLSPNFAHKI